MKTFRRFSIFLLLLASCWMALAQTPNQRLILKDGSYQIVKKYEVMGDRVRYVSAERGGEWEELPASLVDWPATQAWAKAHAPGAPGPVVTNPSASGNVSPDSQEAAEIDKEAKAEKDEELARSPTILPGLHLPDEDGVFILDTFHDEPELIEIPQNSGGLNTSTPHNVLKSVIPVGGNKQLIQLEGYKAKVQVHINQPVIYVSLDDPKEAAADDRALVVDTQGAGSVKDKKSHSSPTSRYVIVRVQVKRDTRVVGAMKVSMLGKTEQSVDIVDTVQTVMPGGHWMKLTPKQPLDIDEYALMEILSSKDVNLDVWDFGVNPRSPEAKNAISPVEGVK
jgi:hypothetical protein